MRKSNITADPSQAWCNGEGACLQPPLGFQGPVAGLPDAGCVGVQDAHAGGGGTTAIVAEATSDRANARCNELLQNMCEERCKLFREPKAALEPICEGSQFALRYGVFPVK